MLLLILISLFTGAAFSADPWTCEKGEIKYYSEGKEIREASSYCYPKELNQLVSESCHEKACSVNKALKKIEKDDQEVFYQPDINPGHGVCIAIGGEPQSVEFLAGKKWHLLSRCLLPGGDFVDTDWVLYLANKSWKENRQ